VKRTSLACLLLPMPAFARAADAGPGMAQLVELMVGLLVVIAAVFVTARILARLQRGHGVGDAQFRVVSSLAVGQKERIVLLQAGRTQLLVGVTPAQVATLHVLDEHIVETSAAGLPVPAAPAWLQKVLTRKP
jgi:flagellar protein FliO/FliZ